MKLFRDNKGFTIVEIILTLTILVLVIPLASNMMIQSFSIFNSGIHRMSTGQRVELALEEIGNSLRSAKAEPVENPSNTYKFYRYTSSGGSEEVTIELTGNNNDYNLILNNRIIAENIIGYSIESTDDIYTINIEYRVRENESDSTVKRIKSLEVYLKNLS